MSLKKNPYMEKALEQAKAAYDRDEVPVGAVIVNASGQIIAASGNKTEEFNDPTAHAEMLIIKEACKKLGVQRLSECDMYVSLEPCPMCAQAIAFARIRRLYYGAADKKGGGVENGPRIYSNPACNHKPEVYSGINSEDCSKLLKDFFAKKR